MTEKQQVLDKLSYWWNSIAHAFWYLLSVVIYGKSDTEVLERAVLKKKAAKRRVLTHELRRAAKVRDSPSEETAAAVEDTADIQTEVTSLTQELKAVRDTGAHRLPSHVPKKVGSA